ncbi:MAG: hypothetical protein V1670_03195 [Candidatus Omnitrophota bacterium]
MLNRKGQNTAEYAILIALVIAVAVGTQTYIKRGLQARMRDESRELTTNLSNSTYWATISSKNATLSEQWEPDELAKRTSQNVSEDRAESTLAATGNVTRDTTRTTAQRAGDFQSYDYP